MITSEEVQGPRSGSALDHLSFRVVETADQRARFHMPETEGEALDFEIGE